MSKRLQDLDQQLSLTNDAYMLVKQSTANGDRDFRIPVTTLLQDTVQTSQIGLNTGDLIQLVAGSGGPALPAVSGEFLTGIDVPEGNATTSGTVQLSSSLILNAGVADGYAATPSAVRELDLNKASIFGQEFSGTVKAPTFELGSQGVISMEMSAVQEPVLDTVGGTQVFVGADDKPLQLRGNSLSFIDYNGGSPILRPVFHSGNSGGMSNGINAEKFAGNTVDKFVLRSGSEVIDGFWNFAEELIFDKDAVFQHTGKVTGKLADLTTDIDMLTVSAADHVVVGDVTKNNNVVLTTGGGAKAQVNRGGNFFDILNSGEDIYVPKVFLTGNSGDAQIQPVRFDGSIDISGTPGNVPDKHGLSINGEVGLFNNFATGVVSLEDYLNDHTLFEWDKHAGFRLYHDNVLVVESSTTGLNFTGDLSVDTSVVVRKELTDWLVLDPTQDTTNGIRVDSQKFRVDGIFQVGNNGTTLLVDGSNFKYNSNDVFHAGNMGVGSGLDADTIDTLESTQFMRSDSDTATTGTLSGSRIFAGYDSTLANSISCSNWFRTTGDTGISFDSYGGGVYMTDTQWVRLFNNKKFYVNNTANDSIRTDGGVLAAGNVTAFSDRNVKTDLQAIPNALDKVCELTGYTYERTDGDFARQTGVIAQEVKEVLPEAVESYNVDGEERLGVAYGNMVGLLVESIKELKAEIEELKQGR